MRRGCDEFGFEAVDFPEMRDVFEQRDGPDQTPVRVAHRGQSQVKGALRTVDFHRQRRAKLLPRDRLLRFEHFRNRRGNAAVGGHLRDRLAESGRLGTKHHSSAA